jgi:hypothetical protein
VSKRIGGVVLDSLIGPFYFPGKCDVQTGGEDQPLPSELEVAKRPGFCLLPGLLLKVEPSPNWYRPRTSERGSIDARSEIRTAGAKFVGGDLARGSAQTRCRPTRRGLGSGRSGIREVWDSGGLGFGRSGIREVWDSGGLGFGRSGIRGAGIRDSSSSVHTMLPRRSNLVLEVLLACQSMPAAGIGRSRSLRARRCVASCSKAGKRKPS